MLAAIAAVTFTSCKKDDPEPEEEEVVEVLQMVFDSNWGSEDFAYNTVYDANGTNVQFTDIRFFISDIEVEDDGGTMQSWMNQAHIIDAGSTQTITAGNLEVHHVHMMDFLVGLNEVINHEDPTLADAPLNDESMHWGWAPESGYKFVRIEGSRDHDGDGNYDGFSIHVATDAMLRAYTTMVHQNVADGKIAVNFTVDIADFFNGVDFSAETLEGTHGGGTVAALVADNVPQAIVKQ